MSTLLFLVIVSTIGVMFSVVILMEQNALVGGILLFLNLFFLIMNIGNLVDMENELEDKVDQSQVEEKAVE